MKITPVRLENALPEWLKPIVTIARDTGLRLSNIINLKWDQVDIHSEMIILEKTKNGEALSVPMTENVLDIFNTLSKDRKKQLCFWLWQGR